MDDCVSLVDAALLHLKHRTFQQHMISQKLLNLPLSLLAQSYSQQVASQYSLLNSNLILNIGDPSEEELSSMRASLIQALSDVSATPEFTKEYGHMNSPVFGALVKWLLERHVQLQLCSCIMLGNLARSDLMCQTMVSRINIHKPLLNILKDGADTQVLHSTLGFARNLALPAENKIILGNSGVIETISRFWLPDSFPQVSLAATSLIRQLVNGSLSNVQKLLTPLSSDRESPAYAKTYLSILLSLFERSDESAIKLEIARTIAAMLRSLNTPSRGNSHEVANHMARRLYGLHLDVGRPIAMMVSQTQWPIVRSEGWFAMALMARSKEGSAVVEDLVRQVEVFGALEVAMTGQSSLIRESAHSESELEPGQISEMRTKDRENAMVLVSELLKNRVGVSLFGVEFPLELLLGNT
ncbi:hypothetical protein MMC20_001998 [Loxospora ochrophaea]|nr:hypothetical protein [Loxospora ochrophaea]